LIFSEGRPLMHIQTCLIAVASLIAALGGANAADLPGDPIVGRDISEDWCGECHDVAPDGVDVFEGVPAFQSLADDPAFTERALRVFFQSPHDAMPDVMPTPAQTDDIIAYILSLKKR
jgi:mono/diheme cytochrome c family protein